LNACSGSASINSPTSPIGIQDYDTIVHPRRPHALEALRTVVDAKLANQTQELMRKLDRATSRLQCVGVMVGVVGVGVMVLQLLVALKRIP
jgi:hypothetical protein